MFAFGFWQKTKSKENIQDTHASIKPVRASQTQKLAQLWERFYHQKHTEIAETIGQPGQFRSDVDWKKFRYKNVRTFQFNKYTLD